MEQNELRIWESRCIQEEMPLCRAACPLQMDVRAVMEAVPAGAASARRLLERHLPLPGFFALICDHPCEAACLRQKLGGPLAVGRLEAWSAQGAERQTRPLPIPRKSKSFAVIGDGLAAFAAAWDLARKGYSVVMFHGKERPGEEMLDVLGGRAPCGRDVLEAAFSDELALMLKGPLTFARRTLDAGLVEEARESFDAVLIDAFGAPDLAPERGEVDALTLTNDEGATCFCGWGNSPAQQAADGRKAAATAERAVSGVSITASRDKEGATQSRLYTPLDGAESSPRIEGTGMLSDSDAVREASRCLRCQCLACVGECAYLQHYKGYPKMYARQIYNNAAIVKGQHLANSLINGCSLCGQCEELCPENFSMADLCLSARREMVERGFMPPSAHEFALEDMDAANSEACALFLADPASGNSRCSHLFFPGCQLVASRGGQVLRVYAHLRNGLDGGVALGLRCCGVPARWAGREDLFAESSAELRRQWKALGRPRVITACASCLKTLRESQPDMNLVSLWEVLEKECPEPESLLQLTLTVQDPCSARHDEAWLSSVRALLVRHGVTVEEPRLSGDKTACCGYGGLTWSAQPAVASAMAAHRAAQLPHDAVASCIMCRDRLVAEGKKCWHMLDVLFPSGEAGTFDPAEAGPGLSARRVARTEFKRRVLRDIAGRDIPEPEEGGPELLVAPDLLERLEGRHILLEDMLRVIREAEAAGTAFQDRRSGHFLASWRPSRVTYWVEYAVEDGPEGRVFIVHDAYSHRMIVPGTGNVSESMDEARADHRPCSK